MTKYWKDKLYCSNCGGTNVTVVVWFAPNVDKMVRLADPESVENCWCDDCESHEYLANLQELYEVFLDVPVDKDGNITEKFMCF